MRETIETVIERFVRERRLFTALDVSNQLKKEFANVRHREVAPIVRELFDAHEFMGEDYRRTLIDVWPGGGGKTVQAFLYHPDTSELEQYSQQSRRQAPGHPESLQPSGAADGWG